MTVRIGERLQPDEVDLGNDEQTLRSAGTIDLVLKVGQSRPAPARPGQRVALRERQLAQQRLAVCLSLRPVTSSLLAIKRRLSTICPSAGPTLSRRGAVRARPAAVLRRAPPGVRTCVHSLVTRPKIVKLRQHFIPKPLAPTHALRQRILRSFEQDLLQRREQKAKAARVLIHYART